MGNIYKVVYIDDSSFNNKGFDKLYNNVLLPKYNPFFNQDTKHISDDVRVDYKNYLYILPIDLPSVESNMLKYIDESQYRVIGDITDEEIEKSILGVHGVLDKVVPGINLRIVKGNLANLVVEVVDKSQNLGNVIVKSDILWEGEAFEVPLKHTSVYNAKIEEDMFEQVNLENYSKFALILDVNDAIFMSMTSKTFARLYSEHDGSFLGGVLGFYFTYLRLKLMYPEYKMHVIVEDFNWDNFNHVDIKIENKRKFKRAFLDNRNRVLEFLSCVGAYVYFCDNSEYVNFVHSISNRLCEDDYFNILVYSSNPVNSNVITDKVFWLKPKLTPRGRMNIIKSKPDNLIVYKDVFKGIESLEGFKGVFDKSKLKSFLEGISYRESEGIDKIERVIKGTIYI